MDIRIERETVKGGTLVRDARSGRLISVHTDRSDSYVDPETEHVVRRLSARHCDALKRLVDR